jgi:hypothetical protein
VGAVEDHVATVQRSDGVCRVAALFPGTGVACQVWAGRKNRVNNEQQDVAIRAHLTDHARKNWAILA